jgi:AcrR family transcriptional regulator
MSYTMSTPVTTLAARKADFTQSLILEAGVQLLLEDPKTDLSVRAVARRAEMSERTVFRYFASREELVDSVASEVFARLEEPPYPTTIPELLEYPRAMFERFEATAGLTRAALHSEIYHRIRAQDAAKRAAAIRQLIDQAPAWASERERRLAAANIHYHVVASSWRYYRDYFSFSLDETIDAACSCIEQILLGLGVNLTPQPS